MKKEKNTSTENTETKEPEQTNPEPCAAEDMAAEEQSMNMADIVGELDKAQADAAKNRDLYLRAVADLDTYRRKVQREKQEQIGRAHV